MAKSRYGPDWPKFSDMQASVLVEAPGVKDWRMELPVAPLPKSLTYEGRRYFRMEDTRGHCEDGSFAGTYLWDGWMDEVIQQRRAARELAERV